MSWFERLTGFTEQTYEEARRALTVVNGRLHSRHSSRTYGVGHFELLDLAELRHRCTETPLRAGRLTARIVRGDARTLHQVSTFSGAMFQVASQFNMLEMIHPGVTPEDGVTRYEDDPTQGPACAIAAGAATVYRNYLVPIGGLTGQTADRQLDGLAGVGDHLAAELRIPPADLWRMQNGYALCTRSGLQKIAAALAARPALADEIRARLAIGLHWNVEVTDVERPTPQHVSQAFCSALPVAYSQVPPEEWEPLARLILEAAYEATLSAAALNAARGDSKIVLLTRLGAAPSATPTLGSMRRCHAPSTSPAGSTWRSSSSATAPHRLRCSR